MEETFINKEWEEVKRTRCDIYTRVMWYHRPVASFNIGKKAEFYSRNYFKENNVNEEFSAQYAC